MAVYTDLPVRELWDEFIRSGVTDTLTILEYIATVLAGAEPPPLFSTRSRGLSQLVMELKLNRDGSPGEFLNNYLLFLSQARYPKELFPLPRHLADAMVAIAEVGPSDRVLDLACGTGGLLVAGRKAGAQFVQGFDIDARMARIAQYNVRLSEGHGEFDVTQADAAGLPLITDSLPPTVALLAPPFGAATFDRKAAEKALGHSVSRIEMALSESALERLADGGRGALLVPTRLLSGGDAADRRLRKQLLEHYRLKGIARLPAAALQPYSHTQVYLLLAEKRTPMDDDFVWFVGVQRDGYGATKTTRRLTEPPDPERNDYPLLQALLTQPRMPARNTPASGGTAVVTVAHIPAAKGGAEPALHVITALPGLRVIRGRLYQDENGKQLVVTVAPAGDGDDSPRYVAVWLGINEDATEITAPAEDDSVPLFAELVPGGAIAVSSDGVVLAVSRHQASLLRQALAVEEIDLRPETYLPQPQDTIAAQVTTAELMNSLRKNEIQFAGALARLMGHIDRSLRQAKAEPAVLPELVNADFPMGRPSSVQHAIWRAIQHLEQNAAGPNGGARFFTVWDVENEVKPAERAEVPATLELLCRLGAIVRVTLLDTHGYRHTTTWDNWKPAAADERGESGDAPEETARP